MSYEDEILALENIIGKLQARDIISVAKNKAIDDEIKELIGDSDE